MQSEDLLKKDFFTSIILSTLSGFDELLHYLALMNCFSASIAGHNLSLIMSQIPNPHIEKIIALFFVQQEKLSSSR